jgi:two-component system response regulator YesN
VQGLARKPSTRRARQALYEDAVALMRSGCAEALTLDVVARRIATSPRQLQRALDQAGAPPFQEYLAQLRMERAAQLLRETSLPVAAIARQVGYERHSAFSRAFRRHHGVPPSALRSAHDRV